MSARLVSRQIPAPRTPAREVLAREIERLGAAERDARVSVDIASRVDASVRTGARAASDAEDGVVAARASAAAAIASPTPTGSSDIRAARQRAAEAQDDLDVAQAAQKVAVARKASTAAAVDVARLRVRMAASRVLAEPLERLVSEAETIRRDFVRRREVIALLCFDLTKSEQNLTLEERRAAIDIGACDGPRELGLRFCGAAAERTNSAEEIASCEAWRQAYDALLVDADAVLPDR